MFVCLCVCVACIMVGELCWVDCVSQWVDCVAALSGGARGVMVGQGCETVRATCRECSRAGPLASPPTVGAAGLEQQPHH